MSRYDVRSVVISELIKKAEADENVWLLVADVGYKVCCPFKERFPDRFINCGIAEQNMVGVAAGMALKGKKPYVFSMGNFLCLRAFEQFAIDVAFNKLPVVAIGVGGGDSYHWYSHKSVIDADAMRLLPNMTVYDVDDPDEALEIMQELPDGPVYIKTP